MELNEIAIENTCVTGAKVEVSKGFVITVAHAENDKFTKEFQRVSKPYLHQIRNGTLDKELQDKLWVGAYVGTVLLDWDGLTLNGEPVPFVKAKVVEILLDKRYQQLRKDIEALAGNYETFRKELVTSVVGE